MLILHQIKLLVNSNISPFNLALVRLPPLSSTIKNGEVPVRKTIERSCVPPSRFEIPFGGGYGGETSGQLSCLVSNMAAGRSASITAHTSISWRKRVTINLSDARRLLSTRRRERESGEAGDEAPGSPGSLVTYSPPISGDIDSVDGEGGSSTGPDEFRGNKTEFK